MIDYTPVYYYYCITFSPAVSHLLYFLTFTCIIIIRLQSSCHYGYNYNYKDIFFMYCLHLKTFLKCLTPESVWLQSNILTTVSNSTELCTLHVLCTVHLYCGHKKLFHSHDSDPNHL